MANSISEVVPQLLAQGLLALRENAVMAMLVNRDYEEDAKNKGNSVDIPIPSAVTAVAVSPAITPPANADTNTSSVAIALDQWYEAPFYLTDKEMMEVQGGLIPMQASEAIKALANTVDAYIFSQMYPGVYGYTGTAGTTPFASDTTDATQARKILNNQLAPLDDRRFVFDADAEAEALNLRAFQDMSYSGSAMGLLEGKIERKLGMTWFMDQNVPTHTAGTITTGLIVKASTVHAIGTKAIVCTTAASTGACALLTGDIVTFAGDTQTYTLTANATEATASTDVTLNVEPGLAVATAGSEAVAVKATHVCNMAFHRDAFAFANRPLAEQPFPGQIAQSATDSVSGLSLRLEVTRQHKQTRWAFDMLYGGILVRPALATRIAG